MKRPVISALVLCLLFSAAPADEGEWTSEHGLFVVTYQSELDPPKINTLHAWTVHVETAAGDAVLGATIEVSGGMPVHNHGLPTRPRVTVELGDGNYRLDGMRFHMTGSWEVTLHISAGGGTDTVVISFGL